MKINRIIIFFLFAIIGNLQAQKQQIENKQFTKYSPQNVIGHFYSKNEIDTIETFLFSTVNHLKIDSVPDVEFWEWDYVVAWYHQNDVRLFLKCKTDTLNLGVASRLFLLLNLGDANADKKDEIALVVDWADYSNLNSCCIYTICNEKLTFFKSFAINEMVFYDDFTLKDFFVQKNGKWYYRDWYEDALAAEKAPMKLLKLKKCK